MHEVSQHDFTLPAIDDWISGDDRVLAYTVVDESGNGVDVSSATITWALFDRPYETDTSNATLTEADGDVTIDTGAGIDATVGEFEVVVDGAATADLWGTYHQRPTVEAADGTVSSWRGDVILTA